MDAFGGSVSMGSNFSPDTGDKMSYPEGTSPEMNLDDDPTWQKIKSSFDDILGGMANMNVEMPIALPDTKNPQDVLRYLGELEKSGIDSRASASYMAAQNKGQMDFGDALNMMKFLYQQNQDHMKMIASIIPHVDDKDMKAQLSTQLMNMMQPGYFGTVASSWFKPSSMEGTKALTSENVGNTMEFKRIADAYMPQLESLVKAGDNENYDLIMNQIEQMLLDQYKWPQNVVDEAMQQIHSRSLRAKDTSMYGEF